MSMDLSREYYPTPSPFTQYLQEEMATVLGGKYRIAGRVHEPCCGGHAIINALGGDDISWTSNDIDTRWVADTHADATLPGEAWPASCDWVVSNPAFSIALPVIQQSLWVARIGTAMLLRASFHEVLHTGLRRSWMRDNPPSGILWLPRFAFQRSRSTGKWASDLVGCCWCVWLRDCRHQFIRYAPEWILENVARETPFYRRELDAIMDGWERKSGELF